jgi:hypothetical protein
MLLLVVFILIVTFVRIKIKQLYNFMYMKAMLGISLYSYLYLKLAKMLCLSYYLLCFLFTKIGEEEGRTGYAWK